MRALVVYESIFGNTQRVATAIASALAASMETTLVEVSEAPGLSELRYALVVAGGPTHAFGMSRAETRKNAAGKTEHAAIPLDSGVRDWLKAQSRIPYKCAAAAFDTRFKMSRRLTGSAARAIDKRLRKIGLAPVVPPESFFVEGESGPLHPGEADRAFQWGETLNLNLITAR